MKAVFNLNFAHSNALSIDEVNLRNKNRYELHKPHAGQLLHQIVTELSIPSQLETMLLFFTNLFFPLFTISQS